MTAVLDLDGYETDPMIAYGGAAGQKLAIRAPSGLWMVKFPESTRNFPNGKARRHALPSYTTSPLSEYIGSHVYEQLGVPVHETALGKRDGKIVVACRDFTVGGRIIDFASIKNSLSDDDLVHGTSSNAHGEYLSDALRVIDEAPIFDGIRAAVRERFWDMFVTDAFILNNDRNNGNWGLLPLGSKPVLAPVYDNGQSFFNKKGQSAMRAALDDPGKVWNNVSTSHSFFLDDMGKHILPYRFLAATNSSDAIDALCRFIKHINIEAIVELIKSLPETAFGLTVMTPTMKEFYIGAARASFERVILDAAKAQGLLA